MSKFILIFLFITAAAVLLTGSKYQKQIGSNTGIPSGPETSEEINAYFSTVDKAGQAVRPGRAWWYYPPDGQGKSTDYPARCLNEGCTRWGVVGATGKLIYVAARSSREHPDKYCVYSAYAAAPVDLGTEPVPEVTLVLEERVLCE